VQVDANASRLSSLIVAALVITYLITSVDFILYFLVLDFSLKLFVEKKFSAISVTAHRLRKVLRIEEKFTDGGAKRLAGMFGLFFVSTLAVLHFFQVPTFTYVVAGVFLACSLLDVFINYCLGCQIYYIVKKLYPSFMS
jgi:hypothetical protein